MNRKIQKVAIAVITCNRLRSLERLLDCLRKIEVKCVPGIEVTVVVVENGDEAGARDLVERHDSAERRFLYAHEPRPGISHARNRAMSIAIQHGDYFAFIDDDEWPEAGWLDALLETAENLQAPVVAGPVESILGDDAPKWVRDGGFYRSRHRLANGDRMKNVSTANVLIQSNLVAETRLKFDPAFAITGGSDTLFFHQLTRLTGVEVIYCADALVYEEVPSERTELRWVMRRSLRGGANMWRTEAAMGAPDIYRLRWIAKGTGHLAIGTMKLLCGTIAGRVMRAKGFRQTAKGAGMVLGACGRRINEYHERHQGWVFTSNGQHERKAS